ncbi:MAG: hypothetical protein M1840_005343 [Geoglossum simile]|nr:MAG: hypothetical protein M1840_005343 [Geoglossum simile]
MGGFAFDVRSNTSGLKLPGGRRRVTLTPNGILFLAMHKPDLLSPGISEEDIRDKSKADYFAKLLVCTQALWFCLQVITRLSMHLPVSLLEITTFAHAITTFFVYFMWWNKPSDISEPTLISVTDEESAKICAAMCMRSPEMCQLPTISRKGAYGIIQIVIPTGTAERKTQVPPKTTVNSQRDPQSRSNDLAHIDREHPQGGEDTKPSDLNENVKFPESDGVVTPVGQPDNASAQSATKDQKNQELEFTLALGDEKNDLVFKEAWANRKFLPDEKLNDLSIEVKIDKDTWRRCELAIAMFQERSKLKDDPILSSNSFVTVRAESLPNDYLRRAYEASTVVASMMVANIVYGGVHLLAWNGPLPSRTQLFLWRISAITISAPGIVVIVLGASVGVLAAAVFVGVLVFGLLDGILGVVAVILIIPAFIGSLALGLAFAIALGCICAPFWLLFALFSLCKLIFKKLFGVSQNSRGGDDAGGVGDAGDTGDPKGKEGNKQVGLKEDFGVNKTGESENNENIKDCENAGESNNIGDDKNNNDSSDNHDIADSEKAGESNNTEDNQNNGKNEGIRNSENTRDSSTGDNKSNSDKSNRDDENAGENGGIVDSEGIENIEDQKTGNAQVTVITKRTGATSSNRHRAHTRRDLEAGCPTPDWKHQLRKKFTRAIQNLFWWVAIAVGILYLLSRAYIIVECFLGLPYAPDPVFLLPHWSRYLPHIG